MMLAFRLSQYCYITAFAFNFCDFTSVMISCGYFLFWQRYLTKPFNKKFHIVNISYSADFIIPFFTHYALVFRRVGQTLCKDRLHP